MIYAEYDNLEKAQSETVEEWRAKRKEMNEIEDRLITLRIKLDRIKEEIRVREAQSL